MVVYHSGNYEGEIWGWDVQLFTIIGIGTAVVYIIHEQGSNTMIGKGKQMTLFISS